MCSFSAKLAFDAGKIFLCILKSYLKTEENMNPTDDYIRSSQKIHVFPWYQNLDCRSKKSLPDANIKFGVSK